MPLLTRQYNIASRHPRLSGIGRLNTSKTRKDSGRAGMTKLNYLIAGLILAKDFIGDVSEFAIPLVLHHALLRVS